MVYCALGRALAVVACVLLLSQGCLAESVSSIKGGSDDIHIAFLTDCSQYSDWQSVGMAFSFKMTQQPGQITRVMCCPEQQAKLYNKNLLNMMPTHVAPSFEYNKALNDHYAAYNKPGAVVDWLAHVTPKEDWILVIDSDMLLLQPFSPKAFNLSQGWVVSADYTYLIGVVNDLWKGHIPEVGPRNDTLAGPAGRHADQVGGFFLVHREDLKRYAPLWLSITADVRNDSNAWKWSGDQYVEKGGRPWISEMYGYVYAAAKMNVWHRWSTTTMHYPTYVPTGVPKLMHYGLLFEVAGYKFDKHWHYDFDVTKCPPWQLGERTKGGIFPPPPHPSKLKNQNHPSEYYRDLLSIETVATLNAGFCDYHLRHCSPSKQLLDVCTEAISLYIDTMKAIDAVEAGFKCSDRHTKCAEWAKKGECQKNTDYMKENCAKACGECHSLSEDSPRPEPLETLANLAKLKITLEGKDQAVTTITAGDPDAKATGKAADPDSSKPQPLPHTEEKVVVQQVVALPPPSPPPPSPPLPSPVVVEAQATTTHQSNTHNSGTRHGSIHNSKSSTKSRKDLLIRCYRMSLTSAEVKACASAASRGEEWIKPESHTTSPGDDTETTTTTRHASSKGAGALDAVSDDEDEITDHDHDDLRQLQEQLDAPSHSGGRKGGVKGVLAGLSTWQAVSLWAVVLVVLLMATPRLLKMRRRQRSGMRSE